MQSEQKERQEEAAARKTLLDRAVARFVSHLPESKLPDDSQVRKALNDTEQLLVDELCSPAWLAKIQQKADLDDSRIAFARLEFITWKNEHPLQLPAPTFTERMNGFKLAVAVMLGALAGGLLLSGAFNFLSDDPKTGQVLGSLIGAGGMVLVMWYASESKSVRRYLAAALGVATAAEVAILFGKLSGLGTLWSALRSRLLGKGILVGLRRFFAYAGIVFLLRMSVRQPVFNRMEYQKNLHVCLSLWLDNAFDFLRNLLIQKELPPAESEPLSQKQTAGRLGGYLMKLHQSPASELPAAVAEMLLAARNIGFEGLAGEPAFITGQTAAAKQMVWEDALAEQYNTLGAIDEGDPVFVESLPVIQDGRVIEKGNVRKVRKRS